MASVNKKKKPEIRMPVTNLIPEKWYLFKKHIPYKYFYIGKNSFGNLIFEQFHRSSNQSLGFISYIEKEIVNFYPVPEPHKRYLYWIKNKTDGVISVLGPYVKKTTINLYYSDLLKEEIIIYDENS